MPRGPQRYQLTLEFLLRDRSDYAHVRRRFQAAIKEIEQTTVGLLTDYLSIAKLDDKPEDKL